jgi:hypothetical protein
LLRLGDGKLDWLVEGEVLSVERISCRLNVFGKRKSKVVDDGLLINIVKRGGMEDEQTGSIHLSPAADGNNKCYIVHVNGVQSLIGETISVVQHIDLAPIVKDKKMSDRWLVAMTTKNGIASIEMRHDHKGHGSGCLNVYKDRPRDKVGDHHSEKYIFLL